MDKAGRRGVGLPLPLLLLLLLIMQRAEGQLDRLDYTRVCQLCSATRFRPGSVYEKAARGVVNKVVAAASSTVLEFHDSNTLVENGASATVFAQGSCAGYLGLPRCTECLRFLSDIIFTSCRGAFGARIRLRSCYLRYESYPFEDAPYKTGAPEKCTLTNPLKTELIRIYLPSV